MSARGRAAAPGFALFALAVFLGSSDARGSVAIAVTFDELVERASAVVVVTPVEQRALVEGGRIVTYTHVRVDRRVVGPVVGDFWVRALGGAVGRIGQIVEGQPLFEIDRPALVFVRPYTSGASGADPARGAPPEAWSVVEAAQGEYLVSTRASSPPGPEDEPRLSIAKDVGALVPPAHAPADARFAREVLEDRSVEDAAHLIAAEWARLHPR